MSFLIGRAKQPASVITLSISQIMTILNDEHLPIFPLEIITHPSIPRFLAFQREVSDWALLWECSFPQHIASQPGWNGQTWRCCRLVRQYLVKHVTIQNPIPKCPAAHAIQLKKKLQTYFASWSIWLKKVWYRLVDSKNTRKNMSFVSQRVVFRLKIPIRVEHESWMTPMNTRFLFGNHNVQVPCATFGAQCHVGARMHEESLGYFGTMILYPSPVPKNPKQVRCACPMEVTPFTPTWEKEKAWSVWRGIRQMSKEICIVKSTKWQTYWKRTGQDIAWCFFVKLLSQRWF